MSRHTAETALDAMTGRPVYLEQGYATAARVGEVGIGAMAHMQRLATANPTAEVASWLERKSALVADYGLSPGPVDKIFAYSDGIAIIPIHGMLINRFGYSWGFVTGYNFIRTQLAAALEDDDVKLIAYDVNSYGGMAAGAQETSDEMYASRSVKPSVAIVDFSCYSAAYFIASAANKIVVTPSSGVGSIGVLLVRPDVTKALDQAGVALNVLYAGDRKLDQQPFVALSPAAKERLQATVDSCYEVFVAAVVRNRGLDDGAVRATEAGCFDATAALELNLIDSIQPPAAALEAAVCDLLSDPDDDEPGEDNNDDEDKPDMAKTPAEIAAEAAAVQATADAAAAVQATAISNAATAAVTADRARSAAILGHAEAAGKGKLALHLAQSGMSVDDAAGVLKAAAPEVAPPAPAASTVNPLDAAMAATKQPNVTADGEGAAQPGTEAAATPEAKAAGILAAQFKATGVKLGAAKH